MIDAIIKIKHILIGKKLTISVAESLTSGLLQANIARISGASNFFKGGVTTYSIEAKVNLLGVDNVEANRCNAVSPIIAEQMAIGACKLFKSDIGIGTTGYAEPNNAQDINYPFAFIAVYINSSNSNETYSLKVEGYELGRNEMREYVTEQALSLLIEKLK